MKDKKITRKRHKEILKQKEKQERKKENKERNQQGLLSKSNKKSFELIKIEKMVTRAQPSRSRR